MGIESGSHMSLNQHTFISMNHESFGRVHGKLIEATHCYIMIQDVTTRLPENLTRGDHEKENSMVNFG